MDMNGVAWWGLAWNACCLAAFGAVFGVVILLAGIKFYTIVTCGICRSRRNMNGKTVLVTGATGGIGLETAKDMARRGAKVILACRNTDKANEVKDLIIKETDNERIVVHKLDLCSQRSIRAFAEEINRSEEKLDVLIHNAGTAETKTHVTEDGLEATMATNHFGPFLLTHLLIDLLKKSERARIVVVSSFTYHLASLDLDRLNPLDRYIPAFQYFVSKRANIAFTLELARRLQGSNVTVNCLHPGLIQTGIYRHVRRPFKWFVNLVMITFFKTPVQGAQTTIFLAVDEKLEGISGKYFADCKEVRLSRSVRCPAQAKKLWELSEKFANLKETDPKI